MAQRKIWTLQEDKVLKHLVQTKNLKKWSEISNIMTNQFQLFQRNGKQCRQRYLNHLASDINKDQWTKEQQQKLIELHNALGNKWSSISKQIKGRTDNCVKNHFYAKLRKCIRQINNIIEKKLKKEFKPLKIQFIYKLVEFADQKYKQNPLVKPQIFQQSYQLKNKIIFVDKVKIQDSQQQNLQKIVELIRQINLFNRKNKKKLRKKNRRQVSQDFDKSSTQKKQKKEKKEKQSKLIKQEYSSQSLSQENYQNQQIIDQNQVQVEDKQKYSNQSKNNKDLLLQSNKVNLKTQNGICHEEQNKNQIGRLHSLSIQKQEEFKNIVNNLSNSQKQLQSRLFSRIDPFLNRPFNSNQQQKQQVPNILMEGEIGSQMKTSRLRSFGSIQASVEYHNNCQSKFLDKQFLSKSQMQIFLANLNAPNIN